MDNLKELILRIARPLEYAARSGTHGLSALKDLGRFVSQQVVTTLGHSIHPPGVEADLLHLLHLFSDYETLGPALRGRRIAEAKVVLDRLLRSVEESATLSPGPAKPAHRLWELPICDRAQSLVSRYGEMAAAMATAPTRVSSLATKAMRRIFSSRSSFEYPKPFASICRISSPSSTSTGKLISWSCF